MSVWEVRVKKKVLKGLDKLPEGIRTRFAALKTDLELGGLNPGKRWKNYSKLGPKKHHCHLTYSYVACWEELDGKIKIMEVYYAGSREKAPY